jgi:hypothetical protein
VLPHVSFRQACASAALAKAAPRPVFLERLSHQVLLALRRHTADRGIAVEIGWKRVDFGASRDGVVGGFFPECPIREKRLSRAVLLDCRALK